MSKTLQNRIIRLEEQAANSADTRQQILLVNFHNNKPDKRQLKAAEAAKRRGDNPLILNLRNWSPAGWRAAHE